MLRVPLDGKNHILLPNERAWTVFRSELNDFLDADEGRDDAAGAETVSLTGSAGM